jgi:preprotein translocase subunit SecA
MRELERRVVLSVLDRKWREHLYEMDYLQEGIQLRSYGQRDPLVEYQREGFALYQQMMGSIREESVGFLFNLEVEVSAGVDGGGNVTASIPTVEARGLGQSGAPAERLSYSAPNADNQGEVEVRNQRGQLERAATAKAQQQAEQAAAAGQQGQQPQQPQQGEPQRGAFGQRIDPNAPPPANRAERRARERGRG